MAYKHAKLCPGCGEPNLWSGATLICDHCLDMIKLGKTVEKDANDKSKVSVSVEPIHLSGDIGYRAWAQAPPDLDACLRELNKADKCWVEILGGNAAAGNGAYSTEFIGDRAGGRPKCALPHVSVTVGQLEAVTRYNGILKKAIKAAYMIGFEFGRKLIVQLASGAITMEELDRRVKEEERRSHE